jgi:hypothetical protein
MTSHTGRLYALALSLVVFFLAWAAIAAHPWASSTQDPRLKALALREAQLRRQGALVNRLVAQRQATYRARLRARQAAIAAARSATQQLAAAPAAVAPSVRVVTLPPLTVTRTS